jgi:hypothetical protein
MIMEMEVFHEQERPSFASLALGQTPWRDMGLQQGDDPDHVFVSETEVDVRGRPFRLVAEKKVREGYREFTFTLVHGESKVELSMVLDAHDGNIYSSIKKEDPLFRFPREIGMKLYEKGLDFLQKAVDEDGNPYVHHIERYTNVSKTPLSDARWNELFVPVLKARQYQEISDGHWVKNYDPHADQN